METPYRFSPTAEAVLRRAGWSPERRVDTEAYEALYRKEGFPLLPFMTEFLRSFGGIVVYDTAMYPNYNYLVFRIDPFEAVEYTDRARIDEWVVEQLVPIGVCMTSTMFVAEDGVVFGDGCLPPDMMHLGNSLVEAIESFCRTR